MSDLTSSHSPASLSADTPVSTNTEPALLEVRNLTTVFDRRGLPPVCAVNNVSFELGQGRVLGIVGESGSGKSVTARSILRLLRTPGRVVEGEVLLSGRNLLALPEAQMRAIRGKKIAMIFQDPQSALNPVMRVGEQIAEALQVHGDSPAQARSRALDLLRQVGIPDVERNIRNYPHEFSGGMRQRVVIAIALANKPQVLIADEPTTALDVTIQAQILRLLVELRRDLGVSIIMITHDMGVVAELCDDMIVMYGGRVLERGTVNDVFSHPRHPYTAALLNAVPRLDRPEAALDAIPGSPPVPARLPSGCAFHPRCRFVQEKCRQAVPDVVRFNNGQEAICWFADQDHAPLAATVMAEHIPPKSTTPILKVSKLRTDVAAGSGGLLRRHTPVFAVDGISLEVHAGQTLGLVGESGCGKSSLSRTIVGIVQSSSGSIEVAGHDVTIMDEVARQRVNTNIQYVFQDPSAALNPRRTIGQSLQEALDVVGVRGHAAYERAAQLMNLVGLDPDYLQRYPFEISGGQRQRVGIARALAVEPTLLICDEPVSALDVSIQAQIINLLAQLRDELRLGYLFIAHDLSVVRHISDTVAVMYLGKIVEIGPADTVYNCPQHPYTVALLSSTPKPQLGADLNSKQLLTGDMPSPAKPPSGCRFRTRCPIGPIAADAPADRCRCETEEPILRECATGQQVACHFPGELKALSDT